MKPVIYVVEDDASLQEVYSYSLESEFVCRCFATGEPFFESMKAELPNLILLDVMLPGEDGFSILQRLKSDIATAHIPVIMVSAKDEEMCKVKGLNMGADDYIAKPFGVLELLARIKANLRKTGKPDAEKLSYKDIIIDAEKHMIIVNGYPLRTTLKEYRLLCMLCSGAEKVQQRENIFMEVWGESFLGESRTLDIHIKELRRKLVEAGSQTQIKTIRGVGYMLT